MSSDFIATGAGQGREIRLRVINIKSNIQQGVNERAESVQTRKESASDYATLERRVD